MYILPEWIMLGIYEITNGDNDHEKWTAGDNKRTNSPYSSLDGCRKRGIPSRRVYSTKDGPNDGDGADDVDFIAIGDMQGHSIERMDMISTIFDVTASSSKFDHIAQSREDGDDRVVWPFDEDGRSSKTCEQAGWGIFSIDFEMILRLRTTHQNICETSASALGSALRHPLLSAEATRVGFLLTLALSIRGKTTASK